MLVRYGPVGQNLFMLINFFAAARAQVIRIGTLPLQTRFSSEVFSGIWRDLTVWCHFYRIRATTFSAQLLKAAGSMIIYMYTKGQRRSGTSKPLPLRPVQDNVFLHGRLLSQLCLFNILLYCLCAPLPSFPLAPASLEYRNLSLHDMGSYKLPYHVYQLYCVER